MFTWNVEMLSTWGTLRQHMTYRSHPHHILPCVPSNLTCYLELANKSAVNYASSLMPELYFIENPIDIIGTINWDMKSLLKMTFLVTRKKKLAGLRGKGNDAIRMSLYQAHLHDAQWLKAFKFFRMLSIVSHSRTVIVYGSWKVPDRSERERAKSKGCEAHSGGKFYYEAHQWSFYDCFNWHENFIIQFCQPLRSAIMKGSNLMCVGSFSEAVSVIFAPRVCLVHTSKLQAINLK